LPAPAPTIAPPSARPPKAIPEAFNQSRRVNPVDTFFLVFIIFSPFVIGFVFFNVISLTLSALASSRPQVDHGMPAFARNIQECLGE
jgi:hypothetical protein